MAGFGVGAASFRAIADFAGAETLIFFSASAVFQRLRIFREAAKIRQVAPAAFKTTGNPNLSSLPLPSLGISWVGRGRGMMSRHAVVLLP
eukprot:Skav207343  [mRNA]  locus=scaffold426:85598:85867:- [translate_table: standard]